VPPLGSPTTPPAVTSVTSISARPSPTTPIYSTATMASLSSPTTLSTSASAISVSPPTSPTTPASPAATEQSPVKAVSQTPVSEREMSLVDFVLRHVAVKGNGTHFIAQVAPPGENTNYPIDVTQALLLHCWVYQQNQLDSCDGNAFLSNLNHDKQNPPWQSRYAIFYIVSADENYTQATIRLDYLAGPKAGSGTLITLKKAGENWAVESQKPIWVS